MIDFIVTFFKYLFGKRKIVVDHNDLKIIHKGENAFDILSTKELEFEDIVDILLEHKEELMNAVEQSDNSH